VTTRAAKQAAVVFYGDPPHTGFEVELRLTVAKHDALNFLSSRLNRAVEGNPKAYDRIVATAARIRGVRAELSAQRSNAATHSVPYLTSTRRSRDAVDEIVVCARVRRCAPVGARHSLRLIVERVTLALECPIQ
jgi:hypothetical protein